MKKSIAVFQIFLFNSRLNTIKTSKATTKNPVCLNLKQYTILQPVFIIIIDIDFNGTAEFHLSTKSLSSLQSLGAVL